MKIALVTSNYKKVREVQELFKAVQFQVLSIDITEIQGTPEEIALEKCKSAMQLAKNEQIDFIIIEDSSVIFDVLNDMPGPYIKDFQNSCGNLKLYQIVQALQNEYPNESNNASDISITALGNLKTKEVQIFKAEVRGKIVYPRGDPEKCVDCIFQPNGYIKTYGQMSRDEKNNISARFLAFKKLKVYLNSLN